MTLRDVLNRLRWNPQEKGHDYLITYTHRGAEGDMRSILFSQIQEIHSSWFTYVDPESEEVTIPFHRILEVADITSGEILWKKGLVKRIDG